MPQGTVSFERKVLPLPNHKVMEPAFWSDSHTPLCSFETLDEGIIEDAGWEYVQADFANKFLGGGVLRLGCVQEEIRFMLSPELIVGMLFLPAMAENEAIEFTGSERFSYYTGYAAKFRFTGDFVDSTPRDALGRRCTKIIAIDAKARPGESQFQEKLLLRETFKAYCGFLPTEKVASNTPEITGMFFFFVGLMKNRVIFFCVLLIFCSNWQVKQENIKELQLGIGDVEHLEGIYPSRAWCSGLQRLKQVGRLSSITHFKIKEQNVSAKLCNTL